MSREGMFLDLEQLAGYQRLDLIAKAIVEGFMNGLHKSPYHGFSVEYAEHRIYNPGESTRHIDWKVYAKTGRLYTKSYEEETNLRAYFVIDVSSSMCYPKGSHDKLRFSVYAAAALAHLFHKQRDGVGLFTFSQHIELEMPAKSTHTHLHTLLGTLGTLSSDPKQQKKTEISKSLHDIVNKIPKCSMVIIFSDLLVEGGTQPLLGALQHLRHEKHEVLLFHVRDQQTEVQLLLEDRPYLFYSLEEEDKIKLHPEEVRSLYTEYMQSWEEDLRTRCGMLGVDFFTVDTKENFNRTLLACLIKRTQM